MKMKNILALALSLFLLTPLCLADTGSGNISTDSDPFVDTSTVSTEDVSFSGIRWDDDPDTGENLYYYEDDDGNRAYVESYESANPFEQQSAAENSERPSMMSGPAHEAEPTPSPKVTPAPVPGEDMIDLGVPEIEPEETLDLGVPETEPEETLDLTVPDTGSGTPSSDFNPFEELPPAEPVPQPEDEMVDLGSPEPEPEELPDPGQTGHNPERTPDETVDLGNPDTGSANEFFEATPVPSPVSPPAPEPTKAPVDIHFDMLDQSLVATVGDQIAPQGIVRANESLSRITLQLEGYSFGTDGNDRFCSAEVSGYEISLSDVASLAIDTGRSPLNQGGTFVVKIFAKTASGYFEESPYRITLNLRTPEKTLANSTSADVSGRLSNAFVDYDDPQAEAGRIRFVSQIKGFDGWHAEQWHGEEYDREAEAGGLCSYAALSMTLSAIGVDAEPGAYFDILDGNDFNRGTIISALDAQGYNVDSESALRYSLYSNNISKDKLDEMLSDFCSNVGTVSPTMMCMEYGNGFQRTHFAVIIGEEDGTYYIADPADPNGGIGSFEIEIGANGTMYMQNCSYDRYNGRRISSIYNFSTKD